MLKSRRYRDRLIVNMGIPIPGKDSLYIGTGPWLGVAYMCAYIGSSLFQIVAYHLLSAIWISKYHIDQ